MKHPNRCDALEKKRQTFFLYSRLKKVPKRDLKLKIFIRMIAEIISLRCALSFQSEERQSVKSFQSNGKIVQTGRSRGETSDAINHQRHPARDCSRSAVVEVAPLLRKLSKTRRPAIVANIFQITGRPCRNYDQITDCACRIGKFMERK